MSDTITGILKNVGRGQFAIRTVERSYRAGPVEMMVQSDLARRFRLTEGAAVTGRVQRKKGRPKLVSIESAGGMAPEAFGKRSRFADLVAVDPQERFDLGSTGADSMRIMDLIAPIGKGTRQLIVSPPKAGKTVLLEQIILAIGECSPQSRVIVLLVDERPEEVTHFRRAVAGAEVVSSTIDHTIAEHVELTELILAHVQTELECGREVVLLIDSLTRVGRAFNARKRHRGAPRGHTMSGGLEAGILEVPRRLFGLARNIENGGSVTVIATCLINTGSRMDQLIFEEFKGTGNSEIVLDRQLAEARIFPAIDIPASGTRKEAILYSDADSKGLTTLRKVLSNFKPRQATEALFKLLKEYPTNKQFLKSMAAGSEGA
ncbi:MAG: transcription termination factor Rho [Planctomycetes bacterium]|nr:transcription termination factor Rho [Planctomycetota bacterium]